MRRKKKNNIVFLGGGGHARVLIELVRLTGEFNVAGILDETMPPGSLLLDIPVLGNDTFMEEIITEGKITHACIAVGSVRNNSKRKVLYEKALQAGFTLPPLIHPSAVVSASADISPAAQIMAGALVQTGCSIKENVLLNSGAVIEHGCTIEKHVHVSSGAVLSGECTVGEETFIGAGSTIINGISIGKGAIVAAGSAVIGNVPDGAIVKGVPAR